MNQQQLIWLISFSSFLIAVGSAAIAITLALKLRETKTAQNLFESDVENQLREIRRNLDLLAHRTAEQLQQFSFETKPAKSEIFNPVREAVAVRQSVVAEAAVAIQPATARESLTERRHRILTLSQRGMDAKTIAMRLGVPQGEVALIIRMSNPSFGD